MINNEQCKIKNAHKMNYYYGFSVYCLLLHEWVANVYKSIYIYKEKLCNT